METGPLWSLSMWSALHREQQHKPEDASMKLNKNQHERLVEILRNTATSCHDARTGVWDQSEEGFDALEAAAEEGLKILGAPAPDYGDSEPQP